MNLQNILSDIRKVDHDFHLFDENDRIAIGISGGKDSILLLEAMNNLKKFKDYSFEIIPIHLDIGFKEMNFSKVDEYCLKNNLPIIHKKTNIAKELLKNNKNEKVSCSMCSKYKKACIIQAALELNCNKIAFAHHADDAIETLFMNMMHGARIATFKPKIKLEKSNLIFIRPLIYTKEENINKIVQKLNLPIVENTCPNDKQTERQYIKEYLFNLYKHSPNIHDNFIKMLSNKKDLNLWK